MNQPPILDWGADATYGSAVLLLLLLLVLLVGHGYANTVHMLAWWLRRHASTVEQRQARRARVMSERWVREIEEGGK